MLNIIKSLHCIRVSIVLPVVKHLNTNLSEVMFGDTMWVDVHIMSQMFLTLLHSERPKLYGVLAVLSAIGLKMTDCFKVHFLYEFDVQR